MSEKQKSPFPMYRGKPLVRSGDTIYYGNMTDKYVIKIDIKTKKTVEDMEVADKCTVQLMLTDPAGEPRPFILPAFMFGGTNHANAEEATEAWIALFDDARRGALYRYEEGGPMEAGTVMFTDFTLRGTWMAAMDSGAFHDFTFTPGVSMIVSCRDQEEIDRYWAGLSAVPEAERCGWCVDRWGVSWQVVPHNIAELMADAATREKILQMGKIDLAGL